MAYVSKVVQRPCTQKVVQKVCTSIFSSASPFLQPVSRVLHPNTVGVLAQSHSRVPMTNLTNTPETQIRVFYQHWSYNASQEFAPTSTLTVRAGLEYPLGTVTPLLNSSGGRDITITGGNFGSLVANVTIPAGATFWIRTRALTSGGDGNLPRAYSTNASFNGGTIDGWTGAADGTDFTLTGTQPKLSGAAYGPSAVCGFSVGNKARSFAIFGDSIARGNITGKSVYEDGIRNAGYTFLNFSFSGGRITTSGNLNPVRRMALARAAGCTDVIMNYPVNDLDAINGTTITQTTIQNAFTSLWTNLKAQGFTKIIQSTCFPKTTDATSPGTPDTTPTGVFTGGASSTRSQVNAWLRGRTLGTSTTPDHIHEMADILESSRDSGLWLNPTTNSHDGLHPSVTGATTVCTDITSKLPTWGFT